MTQRRVLITGAGGFVGGALAHGFVELGWEVVGVDVAFDEDARLDQGLRLTVALDATVPSELPDADLVIHGAWVSAAPQALGISPTAYAALNLGPLLGMLEYATLTRPDDFVFLSSSGVFAPSDADEGLTDAHRPTGTSAYAAAKRAAELLVSTVLNSGTRARVVRLGYLFGPGEVSRSSRPDISLAARWVADAQGGRPLVTRSDDPVRDWTFTPDLAAALERLVADPSPGRPTHLASPYRWSDSALAELIASELPGVRVTTEPASGLTKPPMVPSDIPALRGFGWTDPATGLRSLLAAARPA